MMIKDLFALMDGNKVVYTIGAIRNHAFRVYPSGRIEAGNKQENEIITKMLEERR